MREEKKARDDRERERNGRVAAEVSKVMFSNFIPATSNLSPFNSVAHSTTTPPH